MTATNSAQQVVFANPQDGWLFGPKLWATQDGGHHWEPIKIPGTVSELAAGATDAFAVVTPPEPACYKTGRCAANTTPKAPLWSAQIGSNDWRADSATRSHGASVGLAVHGSSVWVIDTESFRDSLAIGTGLLHSADSGAHFSIEPHRIDGISCSYAPVDDTVVWDYCSGGHFMFAGRSVDAGAHFHSVGSETSAKTTPDGYPNGSTLQAASSLTAVAASSLTGRSSLIQTRDGGASWRVVHPSLSPHGYWDVLGFTTTRVGYAIWRQSSATELWRTTNGGASWAKATSLP